MIEYSLAIPQTDELRNLLSSSGMTFEFLSVVTFYKKLVPGGEN